MRAWQLFEQSSEIDGPGWLNTETKEWVGIDPDSMHALVVLQYPEKFGFSKEELFSRPEFRQWKNIDLSSIDMYSDLRGIARDIDGNRAVMEFMSERNWVRVIYEKSEVNIQAENLKEVWKAARIIEKEKGAIPHLYFDLMGDTKITDDLTGDRLAYFLKYGRIPSKMVQEAEDV